MNATARLVFPNLPERVSRADLPWKPLRPGVDIYRLYGGSEGEDGPSAALLLYAPGATVPEHTHPGHEHIYVLSGSQADENGVYGAGSLIVNRPGTQHSVRSPNGCVVLVIWERPVVFTER
ncbi:MAG TPA: dimethylsulfonioproprionate lyase family protein [Polyangia bacterium]|jgi:anti-sigma factor ChrR (cupin superfamily)|nr:dimethylsulfonioproprionate lyase family protein [Polyangia bacterium]